MRLLLVAMTAALAGCGGSEDLDARLLAAAYANDVEAARGLIDDGADVNVEDGTQQSAYLIATSEVGDDPRLLELTLDAGADVNAKDSFNGTGLIRAAERGHARIVRRLLQARIDVDHVNRLGWTALLEAVILGEGGPRHIATVRALVEGGADVSIPDGDGVTPLAHARERGHDAIAEVLKGGITRISTHRKTPRCTFVPQTRKNVHLDVPRGFEMHVIPHHGPNPRPLTQPQLTFGV